MVEILPCLRKGSKPSMPIKNKTLTGYGGTHLPEAGESESLSLDYFIMVRFTHQPWSFPPQGHQGPYHAYSMSLPPSSSALVVGI